MKTKCMHVQTMVIIHVSLSHMQKHLNKHRAHQTIRMWNVLQYHKTITNCAHASFDKQQYKFCLQWNYPLICLFPLCCLVWGWRHHSWVWLFPVKPYLSIIFDKLRANKAQKDEQINTSRQTEGKKPINKTVWQTHPFHSAHHVLFRFKLSFLPSPLFLSICLTSLDIMWSQ